MGKRAKKTNTGEGGKDKRVMTGKSVSEKSKSVGAKCVSENFTGRKSGVIRNSANPFETSRRDKPQYFVDVVKEKRTKNNNLEFLIGIHFPSCLTHQYIRSTVKLASPHTLT